MAGGNVVVAHITTVGSLIPDVGSEDFGAGGLAGDLDVGAGGVGFVNRGGG